MGRKPYFALLGRLVAPAALLAACNGGEEPPPEDPGPPPEDYTIEEGAPTVEALFGGSFATLPAFEGTVEIGGSAQLVRWLDGTTEVSVEISGLAPETPHDVHVHTWPCAYEGGGHYYIDYAVGGSPDNEIWPSFTTDTYGDGLGWVTVPYPTRGDAMSVIVHDPATGDKLACADLEPAVIMGRYATGQVAPFADYEEIDSGIVGSIEAQIAPTTAEITLTLSGLDDASTYAAHIHALPCDAGYGGGHYKLDPSVEETLPENEAWLSVYPEGGSATATKSLDTHGLREDAQSVVLHRENAEGELLKVACADLVRPNRTHRKTYGELYAFGAAAERDMPNLRGGADMVRRLDGITEVEVWFDGLSPGDHAVHVHDRPCAFEDGGHHYMIDAEGPEGPDNEMWLDVRADDDKHAERTVHFSHLARAEAQSVVVHDGDGTRLGCVDLW